MQHRTAPERTALERAALERATSASPALRIRSGSTTTELGRSMGGRCAVSEVRCRTASRRSPRALLASAASRYDPPGRTRTLLLFMHSEYLIPNVCSITIWSHRPQPTSRCHASGKQSLRSDRIGERDRLAEGPGVGDLPGSSTHRCTRQVFNLSRYSTNLRQHPTAPPRAPWGPIATAQPVSSAPRRCRRRGVLRAPWRWYSAGRSRRRSRCAGPASRPPSRRTDDGRCVELAAEQGLPHVPRRERWHRASIGCREDAVVRAVPDCLGGQPCRRARCTVPIRPPVEGGTTAVREVVGAFSLRCSRIRFKDMNQTRQFDSRNQLGRSRS